MYNKIAFSAALLLLSFTLALAQQQKKVRNTLAEKQLHGPVAQRVVKRDIVRAGEKNTDAKTAPYFETVYKYGSDGNLLESRYTFLDNKEHLRAVFKPAYTNGNYSAFTRYDSSGAVAQTGKVTWLNDTACATSVCNPAGKSASADTTWLNADYSVNRIVSVYEKDGEIKRGMVYYENGWPVKNVIETVETGAQFVSTHQNIVLEKDSWGNPVKVCTITDNRDTVMITTAYRYFAGQKRPE